MAAVDDKLTELWQERHTWAQEHRHNYEDRWIRNWQWYRNTRQTQRMPGQFWRSNAQIPDAYRVIETMVPQHVLGMFRNPHWFSVEAQGVPGETYQQVVKSLLLHGWRKADGYRKTIEGVKMGNILGHFIAKTTWQVEIGERDVLDIAYEATADGEIIPGGFERRTIPDVRHNGPQITFPDLFNIWQDPTGQGRWWIERIPSSMSDLKQANKDFSGNLYKNLSKLSAEVQTRPSVSGNYGGYGNSSTDGPLSKIVDGIPEQFDEDHVELWQCWGWVSPDIRRYDDTQWRLQVIANRDVLIRDVPAPTHDHRPPYANVQSIPIPNQVYGDSVLSYIGDLIDLRSQFENMRRDEALLNIYKTYMINRNAVPTLRGQDMFLKPGGALMLDIEPGNNLNDVFGIVPRQPVLPEAYQESAIKEQQILTTSGATEPFQGTNFGARTTATEVNLIANVGTSRFQLATMWMDETFKRPVLESMFKLYQSRLTTPEVVQLVGEPQLTGEVSFEDLQYDVDIHVDSGLFGSMDQNQLNAMLNTYQTLLSNPETAIYIDPAKFVKKISYRAGVSGADDFVRSPEEVAQIQAAQQQQQLLMAALGAGADGQPSGV